MKLLKNTRLYKWVDDELQEVKILKMQNSEVCSVIKTKGTDVGKVDKISIEELQSDYTKLRPDGYISFAVASLQNNLEDVMVFISRDDDIKKNEKLPYAICRQCVNDLFAKQLSPDHVDYAGISISQESCPANVAFENFFACNGMKSDDTVAYYIGDKFFDDIFPLIRTKKFDAVLLETFRSHCMHIAKGNKFIAQSYETRSDVNGYCKTLEQLLRMNNFEYDLLRAFNIIPTDFEPEHFEQEALSVDAIEVLSSIICMQIDKSLVLEYDKDLELDKIKRKYVLVSDKNSKVYVVAYTVSGKYHIPVSESPDNIQKIMENMPAESVQLAYQHLNFMRDKYSK